MFGIQEMLKDCADFHNQSNKLTSQLENSNSGINTALREFYLKRSSTSERHTVEEGLSIPHNRIRGQSSPEIYVLSDSLKGADMWANNQCVTEMGAHNIPLQVRHPFIPGTTQCDLIDCATLGIPLYSLYNAFGVGRVKYANPHSSDRHHPSPKQFHSKCI